MREYDKMIRGELYNPAEEELTAMRKRARRLFYRYNNSEEDEQVLRRQLLSELFGSHGEHFYCEPPVRFDYGCNTHIGEDFFSNFNLVVLDCAPVHIGKQCFIGPNVTIVTPVHPFLSCDRNMRWAPDGTKFDYEYARPITIGDNVVVGAGSVVTKDLPSNVIAVGNPCHVLREINDHDREYYFKDRKIDYENL